MAFSIRAARLAKGIDRIVVSTDSEDYGKIAKEFGAEVPFLRPKEISDDFSTDYECVKHALDWFSSKEGEVPRYIIHLRPTTPLRDPELIDKAIKEFELNESATALRSVHMMSESAYKCFHVDGNYLQSVCTRSSELDPLNDARQSFERTYQANGYADVLRTSFIREQEKLHGNRVMAFTTPAITEIDTQDDLEYLKYEVSKNQPLVHRLFEEDSAHG